jgi:ribosomal protein S18 acetylase RimI-like enzyme
MNYTIREAKADDAPALARLHVETFNETHGPGPHYAVRERQWLELFQRYDGSWFCYVVELDNGELIGFAKGIPYDEPDPPGFEGELNKIYLYRKYHRRGIGRRLLGLVTRRFLDMGIGSMLLFGEADNPTNGFYEEMGAERLHAANGEFHGGYGWRELRALAAKCPAE